MMSCELQLSFRSGVETGCPYPSMDPRKPMRVVSASSKDVMTVDIFFTPFVDSADSISPTFRGFVICTRVFAPNKHEAVNICDRWLNEEPMKMHRLIPNYLQNMPYYQGVCQDFRPRILVTVIEERKNIPHFTVSGHFLVSSLEFHRRHVELANFAHLPFGRGTRISFVQKND